MREAGRPRGARAVLAVALWTVGGCGDRCERLCVDVSERIAECGASFEDYGARSRRAWSRGCEGDWSDTRRSLARRDLEVALRTCGEAAEDLESWSCDEVLAAWPPATGDSGP